MNTTLDECTRILTEAERQNILLRVIGGMAIRLHSPIATSRPELQREYADLDFVTATPDDQRMRPLFESLGFTPNARFNALQGKTRMIFNSPDGEWHIDIFINEFRMCHVIRFSRTRLMADPMTIPLAELLLTKMQIVEINQKDIKDIVALILEHPFGSGDNETISIDRILELTSKDWGLYTTISDNIERMTDYVKRIELPDRDVQTIVCQLNELKSRMIQAEKTFSWKLRAMFGKTFRWYEEPEDAAREAILKLE